MFMVDLSNADATAALFHQAAEAMHSQPYRQGSIVRLPARGRLLATGDLHDNPEHLRKIIGLARLDQSDDHHVVFHEMIHGERLINGMDFSYRMLGRVAELVTQFPSQVHPMLANHELAQMTGAGVSKGAGNSVELFNDALDYAFGEDVVVVNESIHAFFRAMPLAVRSESGVFFAHSLPADRVIDRFDAAVFDRDLTEDDYKPRTGNAYLMTWGRAHSAELINRLQDAWGVRLFCLGHEHTDTGIELKHPGHIVLNSDHQQARVLPIDLANIPNDDQLLMHAIPLASL